MKKYLNILKKVKQIAVSDIMEFLKKKYAFLYILLFCTYLKHLLRNIL